MSSDTRGATRGRSNVTSEIREAILRGDFVPGQWLVEADLCEQFAASRGSVRLALHELATDGVVERVANRGARVRVVTLNEAIEIYEVRMAVEALCAAKAAERVDEAGVEELRAIGREMKAVVAAGDVLSYRQLNQLLHGRVREMSGQHTAAGVLEKLRAQSVRQQFQVASMPGRPQVSLPEHLAIIDAICAGDAEGADRAVRVHLGSVMEAMRRSRSRLAPVTMGSTPRCSSMSAQAAISSARRLAWSRVPATSRSTVQPSASASSVAMFARIQSSQPGARAASRASTTAAARPLKNTLRSSLRCAAAPASPTGA